MQPKGDGDTSEDGGGKDGGEPLKGAIGAPCKDKTDCSASGPTAVCFHDYLFNFAFGTLPTKDGYCSATCTDDGDDTECGPNGTCFTYPRVGSFCLAKCNGPDTCRHPGYVCVQGYDVCYPDVYFDCDPTVNDGRCNWKDPDDNMNEKPGGCIRQAHENKGYCNPLCQLDKLYSCPIEYRTNELRHCVYMNTTVDVNLKPTEDKWKGLVCMTYSDPVVLDGRVCQYFEDCDEGSQCDLYPGGTNRCQKLCTQGGTPGCTMGSCQDALGAGAGGPGLCK